MTILQTKIDCGTVNALDSCLTHDTAYGTCGTVKGVADDGFKADLTTMCNNAFANNTNMNAYTRELCKAACIANVADYYYAGVTLLGWIPFPDSQRKGCKCCP